MDILRPVAEEYKKNEEEDDDVLHFFVAGDVSLKETPDPDNAVH